MTLTELDALPEGATVETGSGLRYIRVGKAWSAPFAVSTPSEWLLDPEHSRQPIRVVP